MPVTLTATEELQAFLTDPLRKIVARLGTNQDASDLPQIDSANVLECNFAGYQPVELKDWVVEPDATDECAQANSQLAEFRAGSIVTPQCATLCFLTASYNGGPHKLWQWWPLPMPIVFDEEGQVFAYHAKLLNVNVPQE